MKHFATEEWIDYVNQVISSTQQEAMRKHLSTGCERCTKTVSLWQKVHNTAALEASYQPPAADVRMAKATFALAGQAGHRKEKSSFVEVLFDSLLQPMVAGARSGGLGTRQMLYRADPYQIDIQVEAKLEGNRLTVTGQLLDISSPGVVGRDVKVTLSNHRGNVVHTVTNQFGEFRGEVENTGDLELSFPGQGEKSIVISLRNALGNLPGSKA
ncbi:MAG TPA: hypothetical protein VE263_06565 [Candidatus Angelobacter sp.]|nr:hypothetical protein [Candidatus Angelobacter sp.]